MHHNIWNLSSNCGTIQVYIYVDAGYKPTLCVGLSLHFVGLHESE
jgi:hypothetical protein